MPTIGRFGPYRVFFFSNEGSEPPHVHVARDRNLAKFWLAPVKLESGGRFASHEIQGIERWVTEHEEFCLEAWYEYFGS